MKKKQNNFDYTKDYATLLSRDAVSINADTMKKKLLSDYFKNVSQESKQTAFDNIISNMSRNTVLPTDSENRWHELCIIDNDCAQYVNQQNVEYFKNIKLDRDQTILCNTLAQTYAQKKFSIDIAKLTDKRDDAHNRALFCAGLGVILAAGILVTCTLSFVNPMFLLLLAIPAALIYCCYDFAKKEKALNDQIKDKQQKDSKSFAANFGAELLPDPKENKPTISYITETRRDMGKGKQSLPLNKYSDFI